MKLHNKLHKNSYCYPIHKVIFLVLKLSVVFSFFRLPEKLIDQKSDISQSQVHQLCVVSSARNEGWRNSDGTMEGKSCALALTLYYSHRHYHHPCHSSCFTGVVTTICLIKFTWYFNQSSLVWKTPVYPKTTASTTQYTVCRQFLYSICVNKSEQCFPRFLITHSTLHLLPYFVHQPST